MMRGLGLAERRAAVKRIGVAIVLLAAVAAGIFLAVNWPSAQASPDVIIRVNGRGDAIAHDFHLTLREAMMLATGTRQVGDLDVEECNQVSTADWNPGLSDCESSDPPGAASADTIVFDTGVFPSGSPATITLNSSLPALSTGSDTIDGSSAGVIVFVQGGIDVDCFLITSDNDEGVADRGLRGGGNRAERSG